MADGSVVINAELNTDRLRSSMSSMGSVVKVGALAAIGAVAGIGIAAIKVGSDFEAAMSQVAATMGKPSDQIQDLADKAKEMGATTKFSATEAAEALNYLALAGYDSEKSIAALPGILNLAAAGGLDLAYTSDVVTDSMASLGLETSELSRFNDQLAKTSQKSNTSVGQLGEAILTVGGTAKTLKGGITEMNTAIGLIADNGVKGAEGGTALRNIILSLSAPTDVATDALKKLGVQTVDANGDLRNLQGIMEDINAATADMGTAEKAGVLNQIFNKVDLKSVNALLGTTSERWNQLSSDIENSAGATQQMAEEMQNNLQGVLTNIRSVLEGLGIQIYEKMQVPLRAAAETVNEALGQMSKSLKDGSLSKSVDTIAQGFADFAASVLEVAVKAIPVVINGLAGLIDFLNTFRTAILAVVAALTAWNAGLAIHAAISAVTKAVQVANAAYTVYRASVTMATGADIAFNSANAITNGLITVKQALILALTGKVSLATAAQWLWNAAMAANPIGLVVAAVAALAVGIVALVKHINKVSDETKTYVKENEKAAEATEKIIESTEESAKAYEENAGKIKDQAEANRLLRDEVLSLTESSKDNLANQEKLKLKVDELNKVVPGLGLSYDALSGSLNLTAEEIEKVILAQEKELELDEQVARSNALREERASLERQIAESSERIAQTTAMLSETENLTMADKKALNETLVAQNAEYNNLQTALASNIEQYDLLDGQIAENMAIVGEADAVLGEHQNKMEENKNQLEAQQKAYEDLADTVQGSFEKIDSSSKMSFDEMEKNQRQNKETMDQWGKDLARIAEVAGEDFANHLREKGIKSAGEVRAFAETSEDRLAQFAQEWRTIPTDAYDAFMQSLGATPMEDLGEESINKVSAGMDSNMALVDTSKQSIVDAWQTMQSQVADSDFPSIGLAIAEGVAQGIRNGSYAVNSAMQSLANSALQSARSSLDIHSPSKVMEEIGMFIAQGLASGIEENSGLPARATNEMLDELTDSLDDIVQMKKDNYRQLTTAETEYAAENMTFLGRFNDSVIRLLQSYAPKWYEAGVIMMQNLIAGLQSQMAALQSTIDQINSMMASLSTGSVDSAGSVSIPAYGTGGIVTTPRLAVVGDAPEAIIPLSKLNQILTGDLGNAGATYGVKEVTIQQTNNFNQPISSPAEAARAVKNASKRIGDYV